uniref:ATP synthase F0 subunit 8 n=1 Tax=Homalogonia obtusa TaxID=631380 RepID=UPI0022FDB03F|nr:ATP synthase F0 subunit 8 [Homalogonia obtusa]WBP69668.1 ATP synthase F0 subunit 8 [Homalogonia obtusa]
MPQMAPLYWEILYLFFLISYIMFNIIMYFNYNKWNKTSNQSFKINQMNWLW